MGSIVNRGTRQSPRWYMFYKETDGRRVQRATHQRTRELAKRYLHAVEERIAQGLVGIPERKAPAPVLTVRELGTRFLAEYHSQRIHDIDDYRMHVGWHIRRQINPHLGDRPAQEVTLEEVEAICRLLGQQEGAGLHGQGYSSGSIRGFIRVLSRMYHFGRRQRLVTCAPPTIGIIKPPVVASIDYYGREDPEEMDRLLAEGEIRWQLEPDPLDELGGGLYPMLCMAYFTGMRKGEIFGLRKTLVTFPRRDMAGCVEVRHSYDGPTKSGKPRTLEMHPALVPVLKTWWPRIPPSPEGLVFPVRRQKKPGGAAAYQLRGKCPWRMGREHETVGLPDLVRAAEAHQPDDWWHALRHTFSVEFLLGGGSMEVLSKLLGHSSIRTTEQHYGHFDRRHLDGQIARIRVPSLARQNVIPIGSRRS
jgi:integrase